MPDMLVKLYTLPPLAPLVAGQQAAGVTIRRALAPEQHVVLAWVARHFDAGWQSECAVSFARQPIACWLATSGEALLGFACYDVTARGFFGPTGVDPAARGRGIGKVLLVAALQSLFDAGYAYAIIGGVGPADFYAASVGATIIPDSDPGIYGGLLKS
ncbi:MAG: GNAT family N-acetyltransferase [Herpetosiphonaceae bacterium]|nr:GNAT family N-acetyltransferase [Herpetosiphonaceae bacterium]